MGGAEIKDVLLLEYEKVKDEQRARITMRENLFYTTLIVVGAVFSALLSTPGIEFGYLALTPVLFVLSHSYYYNDEIVGRMNAYVRESLGPRIAAVIGHQNEPLFQWETAMRESGRTRRRLYQLVANLILYPGASATSLAFFASRRTTLSPAEMLAIAISAMITALMLVQVLHHSDLFARRRTA